MSPNAAAAQVRHAILRKMRDLENYGLAVDRWKHLKEYVKGMATRASKKKGGLGKR